MLKFNLIIKIAAIFILIPLLITGCNNLADSNKKQSSKIKVAYIGELYEAPLFVAASKNLFKSAGLDVELVKVDSKDLENQLLSGKIDAVTADYKFFKYLQGGLDFKLVARIQSGCMEVITPNNSSIKKLDDLKGKTVALEGMGNGPMTIFSSIIRKDKIDPVKDIKWKTYSVEQIKEVLSKNEIDAAVIWEPTNTNVNQNFKVLYSSSKERSTYMHFSNSFIALNNNLIKNEPKTAQSLAIAWLKTAKWIEKNPKETIEIALKDGYIKGDYESNNYILSTYMWMPSVKYAKENVKTYIEEQSKNDLISNGTDGDEFVKKIFSNIVPDF
jgi:NitT/TauT family transport system substrate-binding protein